MQYGVEGHANKETVSKYRIIVYHTVVRISAETTYALVAANHVGIGSKSFI